MKDSPPGFPRGIRAVLFGVSGIQQPWVDGPAEPEVWHRLALRMLPRLVLPWLLLASLSARAEPSTLALQALVQEEEEVSGGEGEEASHEEEHVEEHVEEEAALIAAPPSPFRLRPEAGAFLAPVGRTWGLSAGLTFGGQSVEGTGRVLLGSSLAYELEAGLLFGEGALRPRLGLRGTLVPDRDVFGAGLMLGGRWALSPRFTALADIGVEFFATLSPDVPPEQSRSLAVLLSVGLGFNLLSP